MTLFFSIYFAPHGTQCVSYFLYDFSMCPLFLFKHLFMLYTISLLP